MKKESLPLYKPFPLCNRCAGEGFWRFKGVMVRCIVCGGAGTVRDKRYVKVSK